MENLQQHTNTEAYYMGWYGTCDDDCTSFSLTLTEHRSKILKVYQVGELNQSFRRFDGTLPSTHDHLQDFTELKCGESYIIVLKTGSESLSVEHFVSSDYGTGDMGRVTPVDSCDGVPGPPDPTPTPLFPTPTPVPPPPNELEFRSHQIGDKLVLQVKNILKPTHTNFASRDTQADWSTLYLFTPPSDAMDEDSYTLDHASWPDAAVADAYVLHEQHTHTTPGGMPPVTYSSAEVGQPASHLPTWNFDFGPDLEIMVEQRNNVGYYQIYVNIFSVENLDPLGKATFIYVGDNTDPNNSATGHSDVWPVVEIPKTPTPSPTPIPAPQCYDFDGAKFEYDAGGMMVWWQFATDPTPEYDYTTTQGDQYSSNSSWPVDMGPGTNQITVYQNPGESYAETHVYEYNIDTKALVHTNPSVMPTWNAVIEPTFIGQGDADNCEQPTPTPVPPTQTPTPTPTPIVAPWSNPPSSLFVETTNYLDDNPTYWDGAGEYLYTGWDHNSGLYSWHNEHGWVLYHYRDITMDSTTYWCSGNSGCYIEMNWNVDDNLATEINWSGQIPTSGSDPMSGWDKLIVRFSMPVDTTPPAVPQPTTTTPTKDSSVTWTWDPISDADSYEVLFDGIDSITTGYSYTAANLTDGSHTIQVAAIDVAGNKSAYGQHTVVIDLTPPSAPQPTTTEPNPTNNKFPKWTWQPVEGAAQYYAKLDEHTDGAIDVHEYFDASDTLEFPSDWNHVEFDGPFTPGPHNGLVDGLHEVRVIALDDLGNESAEGVSQLTIDSTPPGVPQPTSTTPTNNSTPTWSWPAVEGYPTQYQVYIGDELMSSGMFTEWTNATPMPDGSHTIKVRAKDAVGNLSEYGEHTVVIDTEVPDPPVVTGTTPNNNNMPTWSWSAVTGAIRYKIHAIGNLLTSQGFAYKTVTETSFTPSNSLADGSHTIEVQAGDASGNWSTATSHSIVVDTLPPTATISGAPTGPIFDNSPLTLSVAGTDVTHYKSKFDAGGWSGEKPIGDEIYTLGAAGLFVGTHTLSVVGRDEAGNWQDEASATTTTWTVLPAVDPFISEWTTLSDTYPNHTKIQLPLQSTVGTAADYGFFVDWGDGSPTHWVDNNHFLDDIEHTYASEGTYTVTITGTIKGWAVQGAGAATLQLTGISQWGCLEFGDDIEGQFKGCTNLDITATDSPTIGNTLKDCFRENSNATHINIDNWNTENVLSMDSMFYQCRKLTSLGSQGASELNTSSVTSFNMMFYDCQKLSALSCELWETGQVETFSKMFYNCHVFNTDISAWNTGSGTQMSYMFMLALQFNQDIGNWNTGNVTQMVSMFNSALAFNQNIGSWDVSSVTYMAMMFKSATSFDQNLGNWDISSVWINGGMADMFDAYNHKLSTANYDALLNGWSTLSNTEAQIPTDIILGAGNAQYSTAGKAGRDTLVNDYNWTITDGGCTDCIFTPTSKADLQTAVDAWVADEASTTSTYGDINTWDVSNITDMNELFRDKSTFNSDISNWNTENVTSMVGMFRDADIFNQSLNSWDVSKVENMGMMFYRNSGFNGNVSSWTTSNVTTFGNMFDGASAFNQDLSAWDISGASTIDYMFHDAINFNSDISDWDTSNIQYFNGCFWGATAFNQNVGSWDISSLLGANAMFRSVTLSTTNYDALLNGWTTVSNTETQIPSNITFEGGDSQYSTAGKAGRDTLVNDYNWTITDGGCVDCGFTPMTRDELQTAVDAWVANEATATSTYGDINTWNVSNITDIRQLFQQKQTFNSDIGNWDVSNATNMYGMFSGAYAFNRDISSWDVSSVTNMEAMFNFTYAFNQNLNLWDTSSVTNMKRTFDNAFAFNGNIGTWDTSNVTTMDSIFRDQNSTGAFNQDISMKSVTQNGRTYDAWDTGNVTDMNHAFYGQASFNQPIGNWDTSKVTNMTFMFGTAYAFNQPLNSWNVSSVTSVNGMFYNATAFNQPLSSWSTDNVSIFEKVFRGATNFNQPIGQWNTDSATSMEQMFEKATNFNQDIGSWNTSSVTNMSSMFKEALAFNAPINNWQTGEVTTMLMMFRDTVFDQTLSGWDTGKCTSFSHMFYNNTVFNKDISGWDTQNVTRIDYMFTGGQSSAFNRNIGSWRLDSLTNATEFLRYNSSLSTANYDSILAGWADAHTADETIPSNIDINFGNTMYSVTGQSARDTLVNDYNWTITDGGLEVGVFTPLALHGTDGLKSAVLEWLNTDAGDHPYTKYGHISTWDVSNVTSMEGLFDTYQITFNDDISNWDTSNVENMRYMFQNCWEFNQDISGWDVSNVTTMEGMFTGCKVFNQDLSSWDVSKVENMSKMFHQSLSGSSDFQGIGLENWDVSSVTRFDEMFAYATSFDKNLGAWDISSAERRIAFDNFQNNYIFYEFLRGLTISTANYDALLNGWSNLSGDETQIPMDAIFDGGNSKYSPMSRNARNTLSADVDTDPQYGWTITDGGIIADHLFVVSASGFWSATDQMYVKNGDVVMKVAGQVIDPVVTEISGSAINYYYAIDGGASCEISMINIHPSRQFLMWAGGPLNPAGGIVQTFTMTNHDQGVAPIFQAASPAQSEDMDAMLVESYDLVLNAWLKIVESHPSLLTLHFDMSELKYTANGESARNKLINDHGWEISDGGSTE